MRLELGREARDVVTGFQGRITGCSTYISGCDVYLIQPPVDKVGKHVEGRWIDDNRLEYASKKKAIVLKKHIVPDPGADEPAPMK